jgi:hypothetical protein
MVSNAHNCFETREHPNIGVPDAKAKFYTAPAACPRYVGQHEKHVEVREFAYKSRPTKVILCRNAGNTFGASKIQPRLKVCNIEQTAQCALRVWFQGGIGRIAATKTV